MAEVASDADLRPSSGGSIAASVRIFAREVLVGRPDDAGLPLALEVWRLAWPAITHMLLLTTVFLADRLVMGNYSAVSLASLQISSVLVWLTYSVFSAFSAGTLAIAGRAVGAGDRRGAARVALVSMCASLSLGLVVATVALLAVGPALPLLFPRAGAQVVREAEQYLQIVLPTLPFAFVEASAASSLQASGDTRTPLYAAACSNVLNLAVSVPLVFGLLGAPELGIRGAAIGTAAAIVLQAVLLVLSLVRAKSPLPIRAVVSARGWVERSTLGRLASVSAPAFLEKALYNSGYLAFVVIIGWLGQSAMATNQALNSVEAICFLSADGIGIAAGALVAQKLGAGRADDAARAAHIASAMAVALLVMFALVFVAIPHQLMRTFGSDPSIVDLGANALYVAAIAQPFMAFATVMSMSLRGAGATRSVLAVTLLGTLLVRLPMSYLAAVVLGWGLVGIWIGSTLSWVFETVAFRIVFRLGRWKTAPV